MNATQRFAQINAGVMSRIGEMDRLNAKAGIRRQDLDDLYPTPEPRTTGWIERGEDVPVSGGAETQTVVRARGLRKSPRWIDRRPPSHSTFNSKLSTALFSLQVLLMSLGAVAAVAYLAAMPVWLRFVGMTLAGVAWFALFKMIDGIQSRKGSR